MPSVSAGGIGSGIEINKLVDELVEAEGHAKFAKLDKKEDLINSKISAYGELKLAMSEFQDTIESLNSTDTFLGIQATSSDTTKFTVVADADAQLGSYAIHVNNLATSNTVQTAVFTDENTVVGSGIILLSLGTNVTSISISSDNATLADIRDAINQDSQTTSIKASIINVDAGSYMQLVSTQTGSANTIGISVLDDGDGNNTDNAGLSQLCTAYLTTIVPAQNAQITLNNNYTVTSSTNIIDSFVDGITITLVGADTVPANNTLLSITSSSNAAIANIETFVDAYNSLKDSIKSFCQYGPDGTSGVLIGDTVLRGIEVGISDILSTPVITSSSGIVTLASLGICTDRFTGHLQINSFFLPTTVTMNLTAVNELFVGENGIIPQLDTFLSTYDENNLGMIDQKVFGLQSDLRRIEDTREDIQDRLDAYEARLKKQFISMDKIVAQLKNTGDYLDTALKNLPKPPSARGH